MEYHVGPYLECRNVEVASTVTIRCCVNEACGARGFKVPGLHAFCVQCGSAIGESEIGCVEDAVDYGDVTGEIGDALHCVNVSGDTRSYWLPNHFRDRPRDFSPDGEHASPVDNWTVTSELQWFVKAFGPEIEVLDGLYGPENVKVRWGVVAYYS